MTDIYGGIRLDQRSSDWTMVSDFWERLGVNGKGKYWHVAIQQHHLYGYKS